MEARKFQPPVPLLPSHYSGRQSTSLTTATSSKTSTELGVNSIPSQHSEPVSPGGRGTGPDSIPSTGSSPAPSVAKASSLLDWSSTSIRFGHDGFCLEAMANELESFTLYVGETPTSTPPPPALLDETLMRHYSPAPAKPPPEASESRGPRQGASASGSSDTARPVDSKVDERHWYLNFDLKISSEAGEWTMKGDSTDLRLATSLPQSSLLDDLERVMSRKITQVEALNAVCVMAVFERELMACLSQRQRDTAPLHNLARHLGEFELLRICTPALRTQRPTVLRWSLTSKATALTQLILQTAPASDVSDYERWFCSQARALIVDWLRSTHLNSIEVNYRYFLTSPHLRTPPPVSRPEPPVFGVAKGQNDGLVCEVLDEVMGQPEYPELIARMDMPSDLFLDSDCMPDFGVQELWSDLIGRSKDIQDHAELRDLETMIVSMVLDHSSEAQEGLTTEASAPSLGHCLHELMELMHRKSEALAVRAESVGQWIERLRISYDGKLGKEYGADSTQTRATFDRVRSLLEARAKQLRQHSPRMRAWILSEGIRVAPMPPIAPSDRPLTTRSPSSSSSGSSTSTSEVSARRVMDTPSSTSSLTSISSSTTASTRSDTQTDTKRSEASRLKAAQWAQTQSARSPGMDARPTRRPVTPGDSTTGVSSSTAPTLVHVAPASKDRALSKAKLPERGPIRTTGDAFAALIAKGLHPTRISGDHIQFTAPGVSSYTLVSVNKPRNKLDAHVIQALERFLREDTSTPTSSSGPSSGPSSGSSAGPSASAVDPNLVLPSTRSQLVKGEPLLLGDDEAGVFVAFPSQHEDLDGKLIWVRAKEGKGRLLRTLFRTLPQDGECNYLIHLEMVDVRRRQKDTKS